MDELARDEVVAGFAAQVRRLSVAKVGENFTVFAEDRDDAVEVRY